MRIEALRQEVSHELARLLLVRLARLLVHLGDRANARHQLRLCLTQLQLGGAPFAVGRAQVLLELPAEGGRMFGERIHNSPLHLTITAQN